jgi:hypothetical protein
MQQAAAADARALAVQPTAAMAPWPQTTTTVTRQETHDDPVIMQQHAGQPIHRPTPRPAICAATIITRPQPKW